MPSETPKVKVAIVHDWLTSMGGAEAQVLELHKMYPEAPIYTSVYDKDRMKAFADCDVRTTYLERVLPKFIRYKHVLWPVLRAHAFRRLDMQKYDLIISSSTAEAKAVKKRPDATHISYCNTPTRYYWSHYEEFKNSFNFGFLTVFIKPVIRPFVWWMRKLDLSAVTGVDYFIANSHEVKRRITKYYKRDSTVIYPAVDVSHYSKPPKDAPEIRSGFIIWGRHVPYKRFDLAVIACTQLGVDLTVVGEGPETENLKKMAGPTITFAGRLSDDDLHTAAYEAKAFLFPGEEDFGIAPVEAIAAGLPVIAYKSGGALDYVIEDETGTFFNSQTIPALSKAINTLDTSKFDQSKMRDSIKKFAPSRFHKDIENFVSNRTV